MTKAIFISLVVLTLAGCGATMVKPVNSGSQYAPVNEGNNGAGEVVYLQEGIDAVIQSRRESAYKQMYEQCYGKYNIENEWTDSESVSEGFSQSSGEATANRTQAKAQSQGLSSFFSGQQHYRHITFKCAH